MVDGCMREMGDLVERFGGSVDKVIGDALMAVFGAPVAHEDDPERAVRAALEIQLLAATKVTGKVLDSDDQRRLIDEAIESLDFSQLEASSH